MPQRRVYAHQIFFGNWYSICKTKWLPDMNVIVYVGTCTSREVPFSSEASMFPPHLISTTSLNRLAMKISAMASEVQERDRNHIREVADTSTRGFELWITR